MAQKGNLSRSQAIMKSLIALLYFAQISEISPK